MRVAIMSAFNKDTGEEKFAYIVGSVKHLSVKDNRLHLKHEDASMGTRITTEIYSFEDLKNTVVVTTHNSVYTFLKLKP